MYSLHCYPMWGNSKYPQQASNEEEEKTSEFSIIWRKLISQWNPSDCKLVKCARSMTKYGAIPSNLRHEAWFVISGAKALLKNNKGLYCKLYSSQSLRWDIIAKDIPRSNSTFDAQKGSQHCLGRILTAYSNFDPSLGYCQGMNYIAALLLHIFGTDNEEKAFWTFVVILRQIRSIFIDGLPGYHKLVHYFSKLCAYHLSALDGKWRVNYPGVDVYKLILTPWFHSLFSYPCLHIEQTARIWDLFLVHSDFSIFIKIAFTIIASNEDKLCKMDFVSIIDFCKFLPCMKYGGKQLIQKSISIKLNEKYLNYTRDLTKFDWQINKELKKEYILHKKKKLKKEREKEKIMLKYKDKEKSHINIHDHDQADNESTISVSVSIKSLSSSAIAVHSVSMNSISITESSTVLSTISNSISNSNSTDK